MLTIKERNLLYKLGKVDKDASKNYVSDAVASTIRHTFSSLFKKNKKVHTFRIMYDVGLEGQPLTAELLKAILKFSGDEQNNYEVEELTEV